MLVKIIITIHKEAFTAIFPGFIHWLCHMSGNPTYDLAKQIIDNLFQ